MQYQLVSLYGQLKDTNHFQLISEQMLNYSTGHILFPSKDPYRVEYIEYKLETTPAVFLGSDSNYENGESLLTSSFCLRGFECQEYLRSGLAPIYYCSNCKYNWVGHELISND